jgi:hypothetical protein
VTFANLLTARNDIDQAPGPLTRPGSNDRPAPVWLSGVMSNHVYRLTEVVGSSPTSVDD